MRFSVLLLVGVGLVFPTIGCEGPQAARLGAEPVAGLSDIPGFELETRRARAHRFNQQVAEVFGFAEPLPPPMTERQRALEAAEQAAEALRRHPLPTTVDASATVLDVLIEAQRFHRFLAVAHRAEAWPALRDGGPWLVVAVPDDMMGSLPDDGWLDLLEDADAARRFIDRHVIPRPNEIPDDAVAASNGVVTVADARMNP
jgi:hypothetical protein